MKKYIFLIIVLFLISGCRVQETLPQKNKSVLCSFVGDILYEQPYYDWIEDDTQDKGYYDLIKPYFKKDDLSIANLEVPIGGTELIKSGTGYSFNASRDIGNQVSSLGLEVVSTANNHAYDRGVQGINNTLDFLKEKDILSVGTYYNKEDREKGNYKTINGIKFGFVSYTYATNKIVSEDNRDKVGLFNEPNGRVFNQEYKDKLTKEINNTRENCDVLIALMHWGTEFTYDVNPQQDEVSQFLSDLDVDIIIGNHPHCSQPLEMINDTLCIYSLGNFVSADPYVKRAKQEFKNAYNVSIMLNLTVSMQEKIKISDISYTPIINYYDKDLKNFKLIPLDKYTEDLEKSHYHYASGFTKQWIIDTYNKLIKF